MVLSLPQTCTQCLITRSFCSGKWMNGGWGRKGQAFWIAPNPQGSQELKLIFSAKRRPVWTTCHEERAKDAQLFWIYPGTQGPRSLATWHPAVHSIRAPESCPGGAPRDQLRVFIVHPLLGVPSPLATDAGQRPRSSWRGRGVAVFQIIFPAPELQPELTLLCILSDRSQSCSQCQFSSTAQSCLTLCTLGFPVHHQLLDLLTPSLPPKPFFLLFSFGRISSQRFFFSPSSLAQRSFPWLTASWCWVGHLPLGSQPGFIASFTTLSGCLDVVCVWATHYTPSFSKTPVGGFLPVSPQNPRQTRRKEFTRSVLVNKRMDEWTMNESFLF